MEAYLLKQAWGLWILNLFIGLVAVAVLLLGLTINRLRADLNKHREHVAADTKSFRATAKVLRLQDASLLLLRHTVFGENQESEKGPK